MKLKQTVLILGLATFGLVSFGQDNKPDPAPAVPVPTNTEPARAEPAGPAKTEPGEQPAKAEPAVPAKTEPGEQPAKVEPAEPAKTDPAVAEPVKAEVATPQPVTPLAPTSPKSSAGPSARALADAPDYLPANLLSVRPRPLQDIEPEYPEAADLRSGKVVLRLLIGDTGHVDDVAVVRANPPGLFDASALEAFSKALSLRAWPTASPSRAR